jgi:4-oxalocrotonate tautomerase
MSIITVKLIEGTLSSAQKLRLGKNLTDTVVAIEGEVMRPVTWCIIEDIRDGQWFIGGQPLRRKDILGITGRNGR